MCSFPDFYFCSSTLWRLPRQAYLAYRGAPAPGVEINPITPVWWDIKPGRFVPARSAHSINTTIKNPARSDYAGWRVESTMTESIANVESRVNETSTCHTLSGAKSFILATSTIARYSVHRWVIEGCMRGKEEGNVKLPLAADKGYTGIGMEN